MQIPKVTEKQREAHLDWLQEITAIPTAAGCEDRVVAWVERWVSHRKGLEIRRDKAGNLLISTGRKPQDAHKPIFITAHLDHPAFVVRAINGDQVDLEFRGGVNDAYFAGAKIEIFDQRDRRHRAVIEELNPKARPFKRVRARLASPKKGIIPGCVGRWAFPPPSIRNGVLHTHACDDLAAVAAALAVIDITYKRKGFEHVGLLLTRAEEIGFIGAIAACELRSVPKSSRLICLENSRSFPESPIGAGPILRVGDRISVFEPTLTNALGAIMLEYAKKNPAFRWQRKLMPGGACEATAFATYGFQSTCVCLPLGNYHNMCDIDAVLEGRKAAKVGREFISVEDFHGLVQLLLICCAGLDANTIESPRDGMERRLEKHKAIVGL